MFKQWFVFPVAHSKCKSENCHAYPSNSWFTMMFLCVSLYIHGRSCLSIGRSVGWLVGISCKLLKCAYLPIWIFSLYLLALLPSHIWFYSIVTFIHSIVHSFIHSFIYSSIHSKHSLTLSWAWSATRTYWPLLGLVFCVFKMVMQKLTCQNWWDQFC